MPFSPNFAGFVGELLWIMDHGLILRAKARRRKVKNSLRLRAFARPFIL